MSGRSSSITKTSISYEDRPYHAESSYRNNGYGATLFYQFLPKTSALVEYRLVDSDYPYVAHDVRDSKNHTVFGGLYWDPTAKLSGTLRGGYIWKRFENKDIAKESDAETWTIAADLLWRATDVTQLKLTAERAYRDYILERIRYYHSTTGTLTLSQKILTKFTASASGSLTRDEFPQKAYNPDKDRYQRRDDTLWGLGAGLGYEIQKWLSAELNYTYRKRDSNFNFYDFEDNLVILKVRLML